MAQENIKSIHFIQRYGVYNAAERAGFPAEEADRLIAAGVAIDPANPSVVDEGDAETEAKRLADEAEAAKKAQAAAKAQEKADKAEAKKLGISIEELLANRESEAESKRLADEAEAAKKAEVAAEAQEKADKAEAKAEAEANA